jgi:uncharacterized protein with PQ loop repeat
MCWYSAIWGGLLPSVIILSAYFIIADSALIFQILYFRKHHYHPIPSRNTRVSSESNPLLPRRASFRESPPSTRVKIVAQYIGALAVVIASGVIGWSLSSENHPRETPVAKDDIGAKILGYLSAVLYLSARIPQMYHNYKLKSTEGLSLLFFMFSTLGNFSFAASILFAVTDRDYFLLNLPWLIGSAGTIFFDFTVFLWRPVADLDICAVLLVSRTGWGVRLGRGCERWLIVACAGHAWRVSYCTVYRQMALLDQSI